MLSARWLPALAVLGLMTAQDTGQQPTFRSRVDLLVLRVRAIDPRGAPVTELTATDFEVTIEGQARQVIWVEYPSADQTTSNAAVPEPEQTLSQKSSVLLIADRNNLRTETSRATLDGAARFVERLPASHDVGLRVLPDGNRPVDMGSSRAAIAGGLRRLLGQYSPLTPTPIDESGIRSTLHEVIGRMTALDGRRTVVYLTDRFLPSMSVQDLSRRAALSSVVFYVVTADAPIITAESRTSSGPGEELRDGLAGLAISSGGALFRRIAGADGVFDRLSLELSGQYVLSIAVDPSGDRGVRSIKVRVKRPGVDVRAQREFVR